MLADNKPILVFAARPVVVRRLGRNAPPTCSRRGAVRHRTRTTQLRHEAGHDVDIVSGTFCTTSSGRNAWSTAPITKPRGICRKTSWSTRATDGLDRWIEYTPVGFRRPMASRVLYFQRRSPRFPATTKRRVNRNERTNRTRGSASPAMARAGPCRRRRTPDPRGRWRSTAGAWKHRPAPSPH